MPVFKDDQAADRGKELHSAKWAGNVYRREEEMMKTAWSDAWRNLQLVMGRSSAALTDQDLMTP